MWKNSTLRFWLAVVLVGVITFGLRAYHLGRSYDIFIDEVTYLRISQNVASSLQVQLYGRPFFLHPPAFFFIEAAYLKLFPPNGDIIHTIYAVRWINVFLSAITAVLLFLIAYRARGWLSGLVVAVLYGLNPFIIRISSLNLLETSAIVFIAAGYWVLISAMRDPNMPIALYRIILAGVLFGIALLIKEPTAFLTILPLLVCFALKWAIERRAALVTILVSVEVYVIYPLIAFLSGGETEFFRQKFNGFLRFLGVVQITGLNRPAGPSLSQTILARLPVYGTTYLLMALGALAVLVLLLYPGRISRLIGIFAACAYAMMAYLILLGTLEEQYFIYVAVPSILACGIAVDLIKSSLVFERFRRNLVIVFVTSAVLFAGWDTYQWVDAHTRPDNTYEQVMTYLRSNVPGGKKVASNSETGQYVFGGYLSGPWGSWYRVQDLQKYKPDYLLWTPDTVAWNFGDEAQELTDFVAQNGTLVFETTGRYGNKAELYHLNWSKAK
jgi:4-amino-4-deoxy-L-arabinose transferase-like glycosyltransferase